MPRCYLLEDTDIGITAFKKSSVTGVIVPLLFNIQRFLRVLLASCPLPQPLL